MSAEQIPPLACDLPPTTIGVTGVEVRAGPWCGAGGAGPALCWRTKGWPSPHSKGKSLVAWFVRRANGFPHRTPSWGSSATQSFPTEGFRLCGLVWSVQWRCWCGEQPWHSLGRAAPKPSVATRGLPWGLRARAAPQPVGLPFLCNAQPCAGPAGGIAAQEISTNSAQGIHFQDFPSYPATPSYKPSPHVSTPV